MLKRILFTIKAGVQHRQFLLAVLQQTPKTQDLKSIDLEHLKATNVEILALDFDGVLASHGEDTIQPELNAWLTQAIALFSVQQIFILSNRPSSERQQYFAKNYPGVRLISGVQKKPYPDGLLKIQQITGVVANHIVLFDDRLLTGSLAACLSGCQIKYIRKPYVNIYKRPIKELFFMFLRWFEQRVV